MNQKNFVKFLSPGTFTHEISEHEVTSWNVNEAVQKARSISERHGAKPFGFYFSTVEIDSSNAWNVKKNTVKKSGMYYLGGKIFTLQEIEARNDPKDSILISNMKCNDIKRVIENYNSYKTVNPFNDDDVVLQY